MARPPSSRRGHQRLGKWPAACCIAGSLSASSCPAGTQAIANASVGTDSAEVDETEGSVRSLETATASADHALAAVGERAARNSERAADTGEPRAVENQGDQAPDPPTKRPVEAPVSPAEDDGDSSNSIVSIGRETWIYERPSYESRRLGYLRFGSRVKRAVSSVGRSGCPGGWYFIAPEGYVCSNGRTATTDTSLPLTRLPTALPRRSEALPFEYRMARSQVPTYWHDVPPGTSATASPSALRPSVNLRPRVVLGDAWFAQVKKIFGFPSPTGGAAFELGLPGSGVALGDRVDIGNRTYSITPGLEVVAPETLQAVTPSAFQGLSLDEGTRLPVAFAQAANARLYRRHPSTGQWIAAAPLRNRQAIALEPDAGETLGREWLRTRDGDYLRRDQVRVVEPRTVIPSWAVEGTIWVDVSIDAQTLVAYEGTRPRYVTLVSTGIDGISDPSTTKATKQGVFRLISKHITATMDGMDGERAYEMREVPWVQYFSEGYALHAAYWHDAFGKPRSHGCINLSPLDARFLFHFTNPGVPRGWHGRTISSDQAIVYVHP